MGRNEAVERLLRAAHRRSVGVDAVRRGLWAAAIGAAAFLAAVLVDAALGLHAWALIVLDGLFVGLAATALMGLTLFIVSRRFRPARTAVAVQRRMNLRGSPLINAVQLSATADASASPALREHAVTMGNELAEAIEPHEAVDHGPAWRALRWALGAALVLAIAYVLMPRVFHAVLPRMFAPLADHPPYTLVQFEVTVEPAPALVGRPASIRVRLTGPTLPPRSTLVFVDDDGVRQHLPMLRRAVDDDDAVHYQLKIERPDRSRRFFIDTPEGRSAYHDFTVKPTPLLERASAAFFYPAYTGWKSTKEPLNLTGLRALEGTTVSLTVESNVPLGVSTLRLTPEDETLSELEIPLEPDPSRPHTAAGRFDMPFVGTYAIELVGADGTPGAEPITGPLHAVPDYAPRVSIETPARRVVVPEGWKLDVAVAASDDIGVGQVMLQRAVNGWGSTGVELKTAATGPNYVTASDAFDLAALGAKAGDLITYFAVARDNKPPVANLAETPVHSIEVISMEEYLEFQRTRYRIDDLNAEWAEYQQRLDELKAKREQLLEQLQELQKQLEQTDQPSAEQREQMEQLEQDLSAYAEEAFELFEEMRKRTEEPTLYEFENPYKDLLERVGTELQGQGADALGLQNQLSQMRRGPASPAQQQRMQKLLQRFKENDRPFDEAFEQERQETQEDLQRLQLADDILAQAERVRGVIDGQQELAQRMAALRDVKEPTAAQRQRMKQLAEEQAALERELADATAGLESAAEAAQELLPTMCSSATALCEAIRSNQINDDMRGAAEGGRAGNGAEAARLAQLAADKLDALLSDCQGMSGQAQQELDGCLSLPRYALRNAMDQMAQSRNIPGLGNKPGGRGGGYAGSQTRLTVIGPSRLGSGESDRHAHRGHGHGQGRAGTEHGLTGDDAESLTPDSVTARGGDVAVLIDVPQPYRELAEAYFKRLAEEDHLRGSDQDGRRLE